MITLTATEPLGTIDRVRCRGFSVDGLYDVANATIVLTLDFLLTDGSVVRNRHEMIRNGAPLVNVNGQEVQPTSNWATQLFTVIVGAGGNPRSAVESWLVTKNVVGGIAT